MCLFKNNNIYYKIYIMSNKYNNEKMTSICDEIIKILEFCNENADLWKNNKETMKQKIREQFPVFYEVYPMMCRNLVNTDDITPLLGMIQTFNKVQNGQMSFEEANNSITGAVNAKYIDGVLNSEALVKERNEKMKKEQTNKN